MTNIVQIQVNQAQKEVTANEAFVALGPAGLFGRKYTTTNALTWGYYGGILWVDGQLTNIPDGTLSLVASATNYIEATRNGVVSANTTGFTAGRIPLYQVATNASGVTSYTDYRITNVPVVGRLVKSVAGGVDVTLTANEARNQILEFTGALTANINVILPDVPGMWWVANNTTGNFTLTVKTPAGSGVAVTQGLRALLICNGTDIVAAQSDPSQGGVGSNQHIAYAPSITPDVRLGERVTVGTLTGNITINAPTNPRRGARLEFVFAQDGTGNRTITWDVVFKKAADGAGAANQKGATAFLYDGANWVQVGGALAWF
ncbi:MAG: hypothetical protein AB1830_07770 [Pseudomonadota bacterium]